MKSGNFGKILVIGLMILFLGASVIPSIGGEKVGKSPTISLTSNQPQPLFEGQSYFILLNDYTDGGGQNNHWSVQMRFDSALNVVVYEYDNVELPLIYDEWTEIKVLIDLDGDWHEVFYGGDFLYEKEWTAGPNNDLQGIRNIGAVDLFANGATPVYYDDLSLEKVGVGIVWSEDFDSYADGSAMHGQGGWKGWDNDPAWTGYVSSQEYLSEPHSVEVSADCDLVHEYTGYTSGQYIYIAWVYIPSEMGDPPTAPAISGPAQGKPKVDLEYIFVATDPDGDNIAQYIINWGDGSAEEIITGPFASGEEVNATHAWETKGDYTIKAKAKDATGLVGPEGTLDIKIPRTRSVETLLQRILEMFPNAFPVLRMLLRV
jgi:hypothetical protein